MLQREKALQIWCYNRYRRTHATLREVAFLDTIRGQLTCIREVGQVLDDELECAVGGGVLGLDELRLQDHEVHEDVAGGDQGVAASGGKVVIKCDQ